MLDERISQSILEILPEPKYYYFWYQAWENPKYFASSNFKNKNVERLRQHPPYKIFRIIPTKGALSERPKT